MLRRCVVGGCNNVRSSQKGIALHTILSYGAECAKAKKGRKDG